MALMPTTVNDSQSISTITNLERMRRIHKDSATEFNQVSWVIKARGGGDVAPVGSSRRAEPCRTECVRGSSMCDVAHENLISSQLAVTAVHLVAEFLERLLTTSRISYN